MFYSNLHDSRLTSVAVRAPDWTCSQQVAASTLLPRCCVATLGKSFTLVLTAQCLWSYNHVVL